MSRMVTDFEAPVVAPEITVPEAWIDYNGHMNVAYYVLAFDQCVDHLLTLIGVGEAYAATGIGSSFTLQSHVQYIAEVGLNDPLRITAQLLDYDTKRIHYFMQMYHARDGFLSATCEQVAMHVSLQTRRSHPYPASTTVLLEALSGAHSVLGYPERAGRAIGLRKK